jgi:hypothetical protein
MRRRWKIALGVVVSIVAVAAATFLWLMLKPARPAAIVMPGPPGKRIDDGLVFGNYFPSRLPGRVPAILLLGGSEGGLGQDIVAEAKLLQLAGFNVLQLGYFNVPGRSSKLDHVPLETFLRALEWLKRRADVEPDAIGIVGYSKGAEAALLVATRYPGIRAVVAGMPSSVVWDALSIRGFVFGTSSWTVDGRELPSLSYGSGDGKRELLPRFVNALATLERHPETVIPVERYRGALMLVCGEKDTLWPSCPMARQIVRRAATGGRPAPQLLAYPHAGHGVMGAPADRTDRAIRKWSVLGGDADGNAAARKDGWPRIVAFLRDSLKARTRDVYARERATRLRTRIVPRRGTADQAG